LLQGETIPFRGTIDHIMVSEEIIIEHVFGGEVEEDRLCPNEDEPSDHLLIGAELEW